jgi:hypothetical protein
MSATRRVGASLPNSTQFVVSLWPLGMTIAPGFWRRLPICMMATPLGNLVASRRLECDVGDPPWGGILGELVAAGCARWRWLAGWQAGRRLAAA